MRLFFGNVQFDATEQELMDWLVSRGHGPLSVKMPVDKDTGRSRGFAFVDFHTAEDGQACMNELHGKPFFERSLRITEARRETPRR